jgi:hypothetical protein
VKPVDPPWTRHSIPTEKASHGLFGHEFDAEVKNNRRRTRTVRRALDGRQSATVTLELAVE